MQELFSPGSLVTLAGGALTVVGTIAYTAGSANLSLPTIFYGIPIFLGGLALKSSELPPALDVTPREQRSQVMQSAPPELLKLVRDVTRWRYGQKAHLESSLEALNLWDDDKPPQLTEVEQLGTSSGFGIRMHFQCGAVLLERWEAKRERLGRFFASGHRAVINPCGKEEFDLILLPVVSRPSFPESAAEQHGQVSPPLD